MMLFLSCHCCHMPIHNNCKLYSLLFVCLTVSIHINFIWLRDYINESLWSAQWQNVTYNHQPVTTLYCLPVCLKTLSNKPPLGRQWSPIHQMTNLSQMTTPGDRWQCHLASDHQSPWPPPSRVNINTPVHCGTMIHISTIPDHITSHGDHHTSTDLQCSALLQWQCSDHSTDEITQLASQPYRLTVDVTWRQLDM